MAEPRVNMRRTITLLEEVLGYVEDLDGVRVNIEGATSKDLNRQKADITKRLLYAAHLADMARVAVMSEYHKYKGEKPPTITV